jgi:hypothetical protein
MWCLSMTVSVNYLVFGGDLLHTVKENSIQDTRLYWSKLRAHEGAYKHNKTEGDCINFNHVQVCLFLYSAHIELGH